MTANLIPELLDDELAAQLAGEPAEPKPPKAGWTIVIAGLKGGIGKTHLAMYIALQYAAAGFRVLLVDADPKSQTASDWSDTAARGDPENGIPADPLPIDVQTEPHRRVGREIAAKKPDYDVVVVDVGGEGAEILESAVPEADEVLIVTTPNIADMRRLQSTLRAAVKAATEADADVGARVVLTKVDNRRWRAGGGERAGSWNQDVVDSITGRGLPLMGAYVPLITAVSDSFGTIPAPALLAHYAPVRYLLELEAAA